MSVKMIYYSFGTCRVLEDWANMSMLLKSKQNLEKKYLVF